MERLKDTPDIRGIKTNESIYEAFLILIEKKSFAEISVKNICDKARISRSTFYDHFEDKYHMLKMLLKYLSEDTARDFIYFGDETPAALPMLMLSDKYKRLFKEIFYNPHNAIMRDIYQEVISSDIAEKIVVYQKFGPEEARSARPKLIVIGDFYAGGIMSVIKLWCGGKSPLELNEMAACIRTLLKDMHQKCNTMMIK